MTDEVQHWAGVGDPDGAIVTEEIVAPDEYLRVEAFPEGLYVHGAVEGYGTPELVPTWADVLKHAPKAALVDALKLCDDVEDEPYTYHDPVTNEEHQCLLLYVGGI